MAYLILIAGPAAANRIISDNYHHVCWIFLYIQDVGPNTLVLAEHVEMANRLTEATGSFPFASPLTLCAAENC